MFYYAELKLYYKWGIDYDRILERISIEWLWHLSKINTYTIDKII